MPSHVKPTTATSALDQAQQQIEPVLGHRVAKRTRACENGELYVEPGWAGVGAWLIDAAVIALAATVAAGGLYAARTAGPLVDDATRRSAQIEALAAGVGVLVVAPLIYGLFYASGRAGAGRVAHRHPAHSAARQRPHRFPGQLLGNVRSDTRHRRAGDQRPPR